jgi:hypothetical protein
MNTIKKILTLTFLLLIFASFTDEPTIVETMIQGKIVSDNNKAVKTKIVLYRNGQSWFAESADDGSFSISLPNNKAYAIKVYDENYKNHVSAIYLEANKANLNHIINLKPKS